MEPKRERERGEKREQTGPNPRTPEPPNSTQGELEPDDGGARDATILAPKKFIFFKKPLS